jgi:hypothetical protein
MQPPTSEYLCFRIRRSGIAIGEEPKTGAQKYESTKWNNEQSLTRSVADHLAGVINGHPTPLMDKHLVAHRRQPGPRNTEETLNHLIIITDDRDLYDALVELLQAERAPTLV